jgi:hypothetical protein
MNNTDFATKNERRRKAKAASAANFHAGRRNRRAFAWRGAFGNESRVYNDCCLGTSAPPRLAQTGAAEYDRGEDYDS